MGKGLVVLEREKIRNFESLLHKSKGSNTLNMFLEKCNIDPLYIDWCISGISFIIPHDALLKRLSDISEGRVSFNEFKYIFKGYTQPEVKGEQIWYALVDENEDEVGKPYYIVSTKVGGEYTTYIKVCPIVDNIEKYNRKFIELKYGTKDGIQLKNMILLDDYIVVKRNCLLSYIGNLNGQHEKIEDEDIKDSSISDYIKNIFKQK